MLTSNGNPYSPDGSCLTVSVSSVQRSVEQALIYRLRSPHYRATVSPSIVTLPPAESRKILPGWKPDEGPALTVPERFHVENRMAGEQDVAVSLQFE
jgi:hypothetical protein